MKSKEECLLRNGVMACDLGKVNDKVLKSMQDYAEAYRAQFEGQVIEAKALRKKGTDSWYEWDWGRRAMLLVKFPMAYNDEFILMDIPDDAELVEIEIRIPQEAE